MSHSDVVIRVAGLGKKYALHHETSERYTALRDVVARQAKAAGRLLNPFTLAGQLRKAQLQVAQERAKSEEEFWALKDVSFEIRRGERVGIIGRNGAGKSTLLKILSRITEPTTGRVEIRGRVASLLEVGTGFHPELTGRENIYLNGAILGMTRREIRSKFDEIVDFAEVEKFLDTPVKRYSSGMYVRLAFAVAAHLEPEILVVDEVLAVGDEAFQEKCFAKMKNENESDKTLLIVSHNMSAISKLASKSIVLQNGSLDFEGDTFKAIQRYRSSQTYEHVSSFSVGPALISCFFASIINEQSKTGVKSSIHIQFQAKFHQEIEGDFELVIRDCDANPIAFLCQHIDLTSDPNWKDTSYTVRLNAEPSILFSGGQYSFDLLLVSTGLKLYGEANKIKLVNVEGPRLGLNAQGKTTNRNQRGSIIALASSSHELS